MVSSWAHGSVLPLHPSPPKNRFCVGLLFTWCVDNPLSAKMPLCCVGFPKTPPCLLWECSQGAETRNVKDSVILVFGGHLICIHEELMQIEGIFICEQHDLPFRKIFPIEH